MVDKINWICPEGIRSFFSLAFERVLFSQFNRQLRALYNFVCVVFFSSFSFSSPSAHSIR